MRIGTGTTFSVGGAKIGEKQSRQSNSKYMQYVFLEKGIYGVQWGLGQGPQKREFVC